ncbi:MAG: hypothetical protein QG670_1589 [Thermoproteota archaeon]|nr:hypothetical protein [Thermoproteota archaeon]
MDFSNDLNLNSERSLKSLSLFSYVRAYNLIYQISFDTNQNLNFEDLNMVNNTLGGRKSPTIRLAIAAIMAALVSVSTLIIRIPIPSTAGYINIGDVMIFVSGLTFGQIIGGFAGGVGSAIADLIGYPAYAPLTLVVKGLEGFLAGRISNGKNKMRDLFAVIGGGTIMILGYYLGESFIMGVGPIAALEEVPGNFFQILTGGIVGIPLSIAIRRYIVIPRW